MRTSKLELINQIQNVRSKNNKYWMDVLRLAFKHAPNQASELMKKVNLNDHSKNNLSFYKKIELIRKLA